MEDANGIACPGMRCIIALESIACKIFHIFYGIKFERDELTGYFPSLDRGKISLKESREK